jgi:hypothetical protein
MAVCHTLPVDSHILRSYAVELMPSSDRIHKERNHMNEEIIDAYQIETLLELC